MSLFDRWTRVLGDLRDQGRYRSFRLPAGIDFTSNDYLGYGTSSPSPSTAEGLPLSGMSSRLLRGHHAVWDEVESLLCDWHGCEAALMMTSGYAANEGLISTLAEPGDWVAADELSHACVIDGLRLARPRKFLFQHNDMNHLEDGLKAENAKRPPDREMFVVTESLFSMDGDTAPLGDVVALAERYGAHVIVDEAHSTGCFGPRGSGWANGQDVRNRVFATIHTGGKALGLPGAYICGSKLLKELLINKCRHLIFTTALPAIVGAWWLDRIPSVQADDEARQRLRHYSAQFRGRLSNYGITPPGLFYVVPVIVGEDVAAVRAAERLQEWGYDVRAIRPPSVPQGTSRLRISIHADHDPAVLAQLADHVARALQP
jgi:8-amino-7-oxononanoate synthase